MTEGCASPPPQVLRQLHNQSPYYNIVRLMASLFFVRIKFSIIGICDDIFEISFIVVPSLKHIHTLHHVTQIMKNRIHTSEKCQNIFTLMKHCHWFNSWFLCKFQLSLLLSQSSKGKRRHSRKDPESEESDSDQDGLTSSRTESSAPIEAKLKHRKLN